MILQDDSKPSEIQFSGDIAGKLNVLLWETDDESESALEEKVEEIMQELYKEITSPTCTASPPAPSIPSPSPSSSLSSFSSLFSWSSVPFVAVSDVQSESCGPSVSDSASTVMAGIEYVGPAGAFGNVVLPEMRGGSPKKESWMVDQNGGDDEGEGLGGGGGADGSDVGEGKVGDDQWLVRVLGWGPLDLEEWTS